MRPARNACAEQQMTYSSCWNVFSAPDWTINDACCQHIFHRYVRCKQCLLSTPSRVILDQYKWELAERSQFNYSVYVMDKKTSHDRFKVLKWNFPLWYNEIHSARTRVWCSWASANIFSRKNMHDFLIKERKMQKKRTKRDWVQHFSATITNDQCTCWRRAVTTRLTFSHLRPAFKVHFSFCLLFCARFQLWRSTRECNEHLHESAHANFSGRPTCFRL